MSELTATQGFTHESFKAFLESRREPDWLRQSRVDAWREFCALPLPSRSEEEWMRTDVRQFKLDRFSPPAAETTDDASTPMFHRVDLAGSCVTVNGVSRQATLNDKWRDRGVVFGNLADVVHEHEALVRKYVYSQFAGPWPDRFAALHAACWSTGTFLFVPRGVVVDQPLHSLATLGDVGVDVGHTLIVLDEGA